MKKVLALVLVLALALSFVACGGGSATVKTGLAIVSSTSSSKDASADGNGVAQVDSTVAAVLVDANGKIVACKLDVAQNKVPVAADGSFDMALTFQSKQELKEGYNMKGASPIGKEWYEQADAFAAYVIGKTAAEVEAIALLGEDKHNGPDVADLAATCTMNVVDFKAAIVEACNNAQDLGAKADDTLGLGVSTEMSHYSALPSADGDGLAQTDTTYAAVTYGKDGKVTSTRLNSTQAKFTVTAEGKVTSQGDIVPKMEQKEAYGMTVASPIGKEWYQQAGAFETYVTGKTAAEVAAIPVGGDHNGPTDADIAANCTMDVTAFIDALGRAMA